MAANYLHLPGMIGNYAFVPNVANLDGSGTLEFIAKVALDDWTPDANQVWISKWTGSAGYLFYLESTSNDLKLMWRDTGPARIAQATVTPTVTDGDWLWVRAVATEDGVDRDVVFYTSTDTTNDPDAVTWTQLGAEVVVPFGAADLVTNTAVVFVGAQSATVATMAGSIAAARVNFAGVTELDIDFTDLTTAEVDAGSFTEDSSNAATVTLNGNEWTYTPGGVMPDYVLLESADKQNQVRVVGHTAIPVSALNTANIEWRDAIVGWVGDTTSVVPVSVLPAGVQAELDIGAIYEWEDTYWFEGGANISNAEKLTEIETWVAARDAIELVRLQSILEFYGEAGTV